MADRTPTTLIGRKTGSVHEIVMSTGNPLVSLCGVSFTLPAQLHDDLVVTCQRCLAIQTEIS